MESCLVKSIMAGGMGFALGGAFGLFMSSVCSTSSSSLLPSDIHMVTPPQSSPPSLVLPFTPLFNNPSQMSYDTPLTPQGQAIANLPVREQLRRGFKDMGSRSYSSAKNFALVGAVYSGTECCIEGLRAKSDLTNSVAAGCITGGILARNAGPQAALLGCGGFAAFSAAIDAYMRMPSES